MVKTAEVLDGEPRIEGRRISVLQIAEPVLDGHDPAYVADQFDVDLAKVHEALAYYYNHPDEMDAIRTKYEDLEAELRERSDDSPEAAR